MKHYIPNLERVKSRDAFTFLHESMLIHNASVTAVKFKRV